MADAPTPPSNAELTLMEDRIRLIAESVRLLQQALTQLDTGLDALGDRLQQANEIIKTTAQKAEELKALAKECPGILTRPESSEN